MKHVLSVLALGMLLTLTCTAQDQSTVHEPRRYKFQLFTGLQAGISRTDGSVSSVVGVGTGMVIPVGHTKWVIRPFAYGSVVTPPKGRHFDQLQIGTQLGYKVGRLTMLAGFGESLQYKPSGVAYLPTAFFSANMKVKGRWGFIVPIGVNSRSVGVGAQLVYTW